MLAPAPSSLMSLATRAAAVTCGALLVSALLAAAACGSAPPPTAPAPAAAEPPPSDPSQSNWTVPAVPLVERRATILLMPRAEGPDASAIQPIAADPTPLTNRRQWVYELRYDKGDVYLAGVHALTLPAAQTTPRAMGRFALELFAGPALLERVRFDFPGLGAYEPGTPDGGRQLLHGAGVSFGAKLTTRVGVMLPATDRGTRLVLWDRATDKRWPLPWPAVEMTTEPAPDAGGAG